MVVTPKGFNLTSFIPIPETDFYKLLCLWVVSLLHPDSILVVVGPSPPYASICYVLCNISLFIVGISYPMAHILILYWKYMISDIPQPPLFPPYTHHYILSAGDAPTPVTLLQSRGRAGAPGAPGPCRADGHEHHAGGAGSSRWQTCDVCLKYVYSVHSLIWKYKYKYIYIYMYIFIEELLNDMILYTYIYIYVYLYTHTLFMYFGIVFNPFNRFLRDAGIFCWVPSQPLFCESSTLQSLRIRLDPT